MVWLPDGEKFWRYVCSFWENPRMWQTHIWTDGHCMTAKHILHSITRQKMRFSQKLSNLEQWSLLTESPTWAFQRTHFGPLKFKMAEIYNLANHENRYLMKNYLILMKFGTQQHIWNSTTDQWPNMNILKILNGGRTAAILKNHYLAIIRIARFQWTFMREAVVHRSSKWDRYLDSTERIFVFLMQFELQQAAAFVSSPIHLSLIT